MIFIAFGDVHYGDEPPARRKSDYGLQVLHKLRWIAKLGKKIKADGYLCTGDLFHRKRPTVYEVGRLAETLLKFDSTPYTVIGNHDVEGHQSMLYERGAIGALENVGAVTPLLASFYWMESVNVVGRSYAPDYESTDPYRFGMEDAQIRLTHGMLVEKPLPYEAPHTLASSVTVPDGSLLINGHNHTPWELPDSRIWNVGLIGRVSVDQTHTPRVLVIMTGETGVEAVRSVDVPAESDVWTDEPAPVRQDTPAVGGLLKEWAEDIESGKFDCATRFDEWLMKRLKKEKAPVRKRVRDLLERSA